MLAVLLETLISLRAMVVVVDLAYRAVFEEPVRSRDLESCLLGAAVASAVQVEEGVPMMAQA